jgi:hypothetical protein
MGDCKIWYRIDKESGHIAVSSGVNVLRAAQGSFKRPNQVIATGRFQTQWAYYATGDKLTPEEDKALEAQSRCVHCGSPNLGAYVCADCGKSAMAVR